MPKISTQKSRVRFDFLYVHAIQPGVAGDTMDFGLDQARYSDCPWMWYAIREYGTAAQPGHLNDARVIEYLGSCKKAKGNLRKALAYDDTAWCSAFVNWCLEQAGKAGTEMPGALTWTDVNQWSGRRLSTARYGCVVVVDRGTPEDKKAHVGFFLRESSTWTMILGGNQSRRVRVSRFSKDDYPVLAYLWPI
jgi:uncharacterized protein (TIGR02594 family)